MLYNMYALLTEENLFTSHQIKKNELGRECMVYQTWARKRWHEMNTTFK
jgi:hypothetical protein